jgi:hypothetical protein
MRKITFTPDALKERIAEKFPDWCPVEQMAQLARESDSDEVKLKASANVAKYLYPTQTHNEHNVKTDITNLVEYFQQARQRLTDEDLVAPSALIDITPTRVMVAETQTLSSPPAPTPQYEDI